MRLTTGWPVIVRSSVDEGEIIMKFGVLTDPHIAPNAVAPAAHHNPYAFAAAEEMLRAGIRRFVEEEVDAVFLLGDLAHLGDETSTEIAMTIAASAGRPVWVVPGNH